MPLYTLTIRTDTPARHEAYVLSTETLALLAAGLDSTPAVRAYTLHVTGWPDHMHPIHTAHELGITSGFLKLTTVLPDA